MFDSISSRIAASVLIVTIAAIVVIFVLVYTGGGLGAGTGGPEQDYKRIITYQPKYGAGSNITYTLEYASIDNIPPNTSIRFLNPFGKTMSTLSRDSKSGDPISAMTDAQKSALVRDADVFEDYILVRLSPELGGNLQDVSAFRAYSDLDPESKCLLGYRRDSAILQDPCHSDIFRISDGYSCFGQIAVGSNPVLRAYNAIPKMRLSLDAENYILAAKPDGQPSGDGTVGEGRIMSIKEIRANDSDKSCDFNR